MMISAPLREPQQERSQATLRRIVSAASDLLEERGFDQTTLQEIAARAGVTVGAFYARFRNKEALFEHLQDLVYDQVRDDIDSIMRDGGPATVAELIQRVIETMAHIYRQHRGIIRAIILRSQSDPDVRKRRMRFNTGVVDGFVRELRTRKGDVGHEDPETAGLLGSLFIAAALREWFLFQDFFPAERRPPDDVIVRELTRAFTVYLETEC